MTKRKIVLCLSDLHSGFSLGLCNPETELRSDQEGQIKYPSLNYSQSFLWKVYQDGIEKVKEWAKKDEIVVLCLGDITHGNRHLEEQISTRMSDQVLTACSNFVPLLKLPNVSTLRLIIGTGVHEFGEGSSEDIISLVLKSKFPKKDIKTTYHSRIDIGGILFDCAHHGPNTGTRAWTQGDVARSYLKSILMDDVSLNNRPPDIVLRGHYHSYVRAWATIGGHDAWLMILPSLCLLSDYARKATSSVNRVSPGMIAMEVIDGQVRQTTQLTQTINLFEEEKL